MRVLLTSAGLETEEIKKYFMDMAGKDMSLIRALFIPTAAIDAGAIEVLPKCMNDLLKCGKVDYPLKDNLRLTNTCALVVRAFPDGLEIIGE